MFGSLKRAFSGAAREVSADLAGNRDFLEAVCAACALVAAADGQVDDGEKAKIIKLIAGNPTLGKLYNAEQIERTSQEMLARAKEGSGRQSLALELDDVRSRPDAGKMLDAIYLIAKDVSLADGSLSPDEEVVLKKIAARLGIDVGRFEF